MFTGRLRSEIPKALVSLYLYNYMIRIQLFPNTVWCGLPCLEMDCSFVYGYTVCMYIDENLMWGQSSIYNMPSLWHSS